jgi:hypothetical protein
MSRRCHCFDAAACAGCGAVEDMIVRDVPRTFPEHPLFTTPQEGQQRLLRLLKAYAAADPEVRCSCFQCNFSGLGLQLLLYALFDTYVSAAHLPGQYVGGTPAACLSGTCLKCWCIYVWDMRTYTFMCATFTNSSALCAAGGLLPGHGLSCRCAAHVPA